MIKEFICNNKYIVLSASFNAKKKRLLFYVENKLVYDLVVALDYDHPDYTFPVNVKRFIGKNIKVACEEDIEIKFEQTDEALSDYSGKYRPYVHFTSKRGWLNDPNGLVYHDGKYLMYYQHNPVATTWENMHWGSAFSNDLVHWEEGEDVLFPDENGTIFSGSGIVDKKNASGLKNEQDDLILFFYTCAGNTSKASEGKPFTQNLAYSFDGGKTLIRHQKPLIEQITKGNRDPKVIYYELDNSYILALYLENHEFALFKSRNLLEWRELQRIILPNDAECPDFYPLEINNDTKWIFTAASDRYLIGSFDGEKYIPETEELRLNYGNSSYAAQSWSDVPGKRRLRTAFASIVIPGMPFGSCMNVPQEMSLRYVNKKLRLCAKPISEIENLYLYSSKFNNINIDKDNAFKAKVESKACDVTLNIKAKNNFKVELFGLLIEYDYSLSILRCDDKEAYVEMDKDTLELRMIYDTVYAELFAASGSVFMGMNYIQDLTFDEITISSEHATISEIELNEMKKFYE